MLILLLNNLFHVSNYFLATDQLYQNMEILNRNYELADFICKLILYTKSS